MLAELFENVAVANLCFDDVDVVLFHGELQAEVRHDGCDEGVSG